MAIELIALAGALAATAVVVVLHFVWLEWIEHGLFPALRSLGRRRMPIIVFSIVPLHLIEIALFAVLMQLYVIGGNGGLAGRNPSFDALLYFSGVSYTSLDFGDVTPLGALELVSIIECVVGLMLIGWSASFTYLKMAAVSSIRSL